MSSTLPHGLITIHHTDASKQDESSYADIVFERAGVLHSFWKVHAIRHRVSKDPSDFRSQNLFWRVWGDPKLSKLITTSTLTSLWSSCQQRIEIQSLPQKFYRPSSKSSYNQQKTFHCTKETLIGPRSEANESSTISPPLTRTTSDQQSSLTQQLKERRTSVNNSEDLVMVVDNNRKASKSSRPRLSRAGSSSNRTSYTTLTTKAKDRPSLNRRKSSQGAAQGKAGKLGKLTPKSPTFASKDTETADIQASPATTSTFQLPSASSWEDEPNMDSNRLSTSGSYMDTPSDLVEPNFRNKFAERIASSSNLSVMNRMKKTGSVVRFADEIPTNLRISKEQGLTAIQDEERRLPLSHRGSIASVASVAIIDEDEMPSPGLPRSKSQLSMMIEENRALHGRASLESVTPSNNNSLSSRRKREPTDHEKVLAMAHKEGVTKAGGRQIRRGFKFSDEDETRWSSPSPPPLF